MHARLITVHVKPGKMDSMIDSYRSALAEAPENARRGHIATHLLVDREKSEAIVVALWKTEENARAAAASDWNRALAETVQAYFTRTPDRRLCEVAISA